MKIWCDTCDGKGTLLGIKYENGNPHGYKKPCPECNGKGYAENETFESEYYERLGRACEKGLGCGKVKINGFGDFLPHIGLMKWYMESGEI